MLDRIRLLEGEALGAQEYIDDFWRHWDGIEDVFWKLERIQTFREPDNQSWAAMARGDWSLALTLLEGNRTAVEEHYRKVERIGFEPRRLRVVEKPISPYLQWEFHSLRIRVRAGERIRVIDASRLRHLENAMPVPELVILGTKVMYEVLYDRRGLHSGARKITDRDVIDACREQLEPLYKEAEPFDPFFEREIAPLPPPAGQPDEG